MYVADRKKKPSVHEIRNIRHYFKSQANLLKKCVHIATISQRDDGMRAVVAP